jgi:hypothetical protein
MFYDEESSLLESLLSSDPVNKNDICTNRHSNSSQAYNHPLTQVYTESEDLGDDDDYSISGNRFVQRYVIVVS